MRNKYKNKTKGFTRNKMKLYFIYFKQKSNLIEHIRTHSLECEYCEKTFPSKRGLISHIRKVHNWEVNETLIL